MRAVIAEDLTLLRDGLARILRAHDIEVAAAVGDPVALAAALEEEHPDIAIVDVRMPPTFTNEGLVAAIGARDRRPGMPVLVLSQYVEPLYARELMLSGPAGVGYLLKTASRTSARSSTRSAGWPAAGRCSTRTW